MVVKGMKDTDSGINITFNSAEGVAILEMGSKDITVPDVHTAEVMIKCLQYFVDDMKKVQSKQ